jgi:hypothetical protein
MTRRRRTAPGMDSLADLEQKVKILEREMAVQRKAMDRLKELGAERRVAGPREMPTAVRKSA